MLWTSCATLWLLLFIVNVVVYSFRCIIRLTPTFHSETSIEILFFNLKIKQRICYETIEKKNNFRNCMERNQRKISEVTNNMLFLSEFHILLRLVRIWSSILFPSVDIIPKSSATASNDCIFTWHNLLISISRYLNLLNFSYFSNMLFFFS